MWTQRQNTICKCIALTIMMPYITMLHCSQLYCRIDLTICARVTPDVTACHTRDRGKGSEQLLGEHLTSEHLNIATIWISEHPTDHRHSLLPITETQLFTLSMEQKEHLSVTQVVSRKLCQTTLVCFLQHYVHCVQYCVVYCVHCV